MCVRECVRPFVRVHGSVCRVSMITRGGKGQRQLTRRGEDGGGEWNRSHERGRETERARTGINVAEGEGRTVGHIASVYL